MTALAPGDLRGRHLLREADLSPEEFLGLVGLARELKTARRERREQQHLRGRTVAAVFEKTSTRTRAAIEVSCYDQGGHVTYLDPSSSQVGHKESIADTARVLSRFYDAILHRGSRQAMIDELAGHASVPVHNMLTDDWHPTQMLADVMTMLEHSPGSASDLSYCYVGDARNNMGNSLLVTGALIGADVRIGAPAALQPEDSVRSLAATLASRSGARLTVSDDLDEVVPGAAFVHTDVWVSMGEPSQVWDERVALLAPYRVDAALMARTGRPDARFMHCLPALHDMSTEIGRRIGESTGLREGIEVANDVFESPASLVFEQAENRMHTIKALLTATVA